MHAQSHQSNNRLMQGSIESFHHRRHYIECRLHVIMLPNDRNGTLLGNNNDMMCMTDIVFLRYMSEGIMHSGMLAVEFEYSSNLCSINYLDVQYSDSRMRKQVEGNPNVLRNIDSHLRNNLLYQEYNIN